MIICTGCGKVVGDEVDVCPDCKGIEFQELLIAPYNNSEPYLDEEGLA